MTEWLSPGEEPARPADPGVPRHLAGSAEVPATPPRRPRHRRQTQALIAAALVFAAAVALLLVVLLRGPAGPAKGSPDAIGDAFAAALRSGSTAQLEALTCEGAQTDLLRSVQGVLGTTTAASRSGAAALRSGVALVRLVLTVQGRSRVATLALSQASGHWCAQVIAIS